MNRKRSSESDFFSEKWKIVDETIDSIFRCGPLRYSFQVVYHSVFLLCQEKCQNSLVEHVDDALQMEVKKQVDQLLSLDSNFCMRELTARWSQFKKSLGKVGGVMLYLDQNYLCDYHRPSVRDRGEQFFCSVVLENSSVIARLRQAVMESVANNVHLDELKVLAHELGKIEQGSFYELLVESPYLSVMTQRCAVESQVHCRGDSIGEFLNWAFVHIEHELDFAGDHLAEESYQKVESALYQSIFGENIEFVLSINGLPKLFRMLDFDSIRRIGKAYAQINNLSPLVEKLRDSIRAEADRILCTNLELSPNAVGEIVLLQQNTDTLCELFNLINENSGLPIKRGLESAVGSCSGFVDALVSFFDHSIRQITKHQLNSLFDDVLKLIRIVKDKDVFEITFRNHMAARLLQTKRGGLQLERLFVERMKVESGSLSVSRLERMIEDFDRSSKLSGSWQSDLRSNGEIMPLDFHCSVLSEGSWPHYPNVSFSIPSSMQLCITQFQNFYLLRHNGRKLTFQMSLGTVEFQLSMQNRVYCVSALTPFSRTIELLNSDDAFSVDSASSFSMLSRTELQGQIAALRQTGLVVDSGNGLYSFNRDFSSSKSTVRVSSASQKPTTENVDGSLKSQKGATRSDSLDCVIVKILKEHKALPHESLCKNVMSALRHIFSPSVGDIKARIQVLIDKGYIARGERNGCYMFCE